MSASSLRPPDEDTQPIPVVRGRHAAPRPTRSAGTWTLLVAREIGIVAAIVVVVVVLARLAIGQLAHVADDAMEPTLPAGSRVVVTSWGEPSAGDLVLVQAPDAWGSPADTVVARLIASGGQRVACCDENGRITVDGVPLVEEYIAGRTDQVAFDVTVPQGRVFVLADRRDASRDSRTTLDAEGGTLATEDVLGRVAWVVWPPRGPVS